MKQNLKNDYYTSSGKASWNGTFSFENCVSLTFRLLTTLSFRLWYNWKIIKILMLQVERIENISYLNMTKCNAQTS